MTNCVLKSLTGSETATYTLAVEYIRRGHKVICFSPKTGGVMTERLEMAGARVVDTLEKVPPDWPAVIHAHHRHESVLAALYFPAVSQVQTIHGVLPWQEYPVTTQSTVYAYVAVSDEVRQAHLRVDPRVIYNGIDLNRFRDLRPIAHHPRAALILSNYMPERQREQVRRVCGRMGIRVDEVKARWDIENAINGVDIVFSLGRGALEAVACKRFVVVYDYNGGDGVITPGNFPYLRGRNFSGRTASAKLTDAQLAEWLSTYDRDIVQATYSHILRDHGIYHTADRYLEVLDEARAQHPPGVKSWHPAQVAQELMADITTLHGELARLQGQLGNIEGSRGYRWLERLRKVRRLAS